MIKILAVFITLVATSMTAVAAFDRGGTLIDRVLLVAMSVVIVLAVHLLLAISRRPIYWLVWTGCLICAVYGHLTFLTHASLRAGQALAQQSALAVGTQHQVESVREALAKIKARPVAEVTTQLAATDSARVRAALRTEIAEGKKAENLRDELVRLSQVSTAAQIAGAVDPVTAKLSQVFGWSEGAISVVIGLTFALLVELVGAVVWFEALRPSNANSGAVTPVTARETIGVTQSKTDGFTRPVTQPESNGVTGVTGNETSHVTPSVTPVTFIETGNETGRITTLRKAIESGKCKGTVSSIREYLGCSQTTAQELRRELAIN